MTCKHDLETRDAYFTDIKQKGKIKFCVKDNCNYTERIINKK